ncbi:MAG: response regulator [Acetobacteraceae bacterium]|nr:response regulator [Acetobacteraceae bacterium]MBV8591708.1 response regulator [Acetobacteraceae bacterium]
MPYEPGVFWAANVTCPGQPEGLLSPPEKRMEALGRMTAGLVHDFKNLLQVLTGSLEVLLEQVADPVAKQIAATALRATERGKDITRRLLAASREPLLYPVAFDCAALVQDMGGLLACSLGPQISTRISADPDLPPAYADPALLTQCVLNLALNARDAMPKGGEITVRAHAGDREPPCLAHDSKSNRPSGYVVVSVADNGSGIDPAILPRVLDPFFTTKPLGEGTGLGLAMVHEFACHSNGYLRIESAPGQGTTVEIWLPAASVSPNAVITRATPEAEAGSSGRILVVDDEPDVRSVASVFLGRAGFSVREAASAEEALEIIQAGEAFDAVVTDHAMPEMSGAALLGLIRELRPGLRGLIITGYAGDPSIATSSVTNDMLVLPKPFQRDELIGRVKELITGRENPSA